MKFDLELICKKTFNYYKGLEFDCIKLLWWTLGGRKFSASLLSVNFP